MRNHEFYNKSLVNISFTKILICIIAGLLAGLSPYLFITFDPKFLWFTLFLISVFGVFLFGCITGLKTKGFLDFMSPYILFPIMYLVIYGPGIHKALTLSEQQGKSALFYASIAFISYLAGALTFSSVFLNADKREIKSITINDKVYKRLIKYPLIIGLVSMLAFWAKAGTIPALMGDLENSRVGALSGNGLFYYFSMSIMISVWVYFSRSNKFLKSFAFLLFGCLMLASTGWRNTSIALIFVSLTIFHYKKPIKLSRLIIAGIVIIVLIAVSGLFRIASSDLTGYKLMGMMESGNYVGAFFSYLYNYPVVFTDNLMLVINHFSDSASLLHGKSLFWNFGILMPGSSYPAFDFYLKDLLRVGFAGGGLPPTIIGDLYLNFGLIGIIFGMMIVGGLWSFLYYKLLNNKDNLIGVASVIVLYYLSVSIRGGLENITLTTTWLLIILIVYRIISKFKVVK
ncbi:oligosaccharide repeat unit polymerase [Neobacillus bataviensis]|uniref:Oligosaccharide repeat unit polymerase n=1 Tax=Neobacillus bataviensis TaxID=220685 RepID=A0A561CMA1_9BACI|nr:O-antigen polymerase [Neobacillus bataviensis]TWD92373.1 oligosaccharide repeat unit polymerase [Neobacillus bataviensis]